jgi:hypothetical protein
MGRIVHTLKIDARLSNHNSLRDHRDSGLWQVLVAEIAMLIEDDRFISLNLTVNATGADLTHLIDIFKDESNK